MKISKLNSEGYYDPTPHKALTNIMKKEKTKKEYLPLVYIASPFSGDMERNTTKAQGYCRFAVKEGYIPLAPHLHYPQFLDDEDPDERKLGLRFALILLGKCEELWVFDRVSKGVAQEIAKAKRRNMPIRYFNSKCEEDLE
ncbi:MAG: DUF4406 domain-containing protein [Miniphocaeibacter sp.]|uniref:DUF7768 domain-containing protein n=1 Tax=Miniphocaeibacter sp. TaxID=3100973 RepID=UPI003BB0CF67